MLSVSSAPVSPLGNRPTKQMFALYFQSRNIQTGRYVRRFACLLSCDRATHSVGEDNARLARPIPGTSRVAQSEVETRGTSRRNGHRTQAGSYHLPLAFHQAAVLRRGLRSMRSTGQYSCRNASAQAGRGAWVPARTHHRNNLMVVFIRSLRACSGMPLDLSVSCNPESR